VISDSNIQEGVLGSYVSYLNDNASVIKTTKKIEGKIPPKKDIIVIAENISKTARLMKKVAIKGKEIISSKEESQKCMVCFQPVYENAIECPFCEHLFHFKHLVTWIEENERCPYCKTVLRIFR